MYVFACSPTWALKFFYAAILLHAGRRRDGSRNLPAEITKATDQKEYRDGCLAELNVLFPLPALDG